MTRFVALYYRFAAGASWLQHPLLLAIRCYWGISLAQNGLGKMRNIDKIAAWFGSDLGIPFPLANAWAAASVELFGSILLVLGLFGRPAALAVAFTMTVAYATSDIGAVQTLSTDFFCDEGTRLGDCFTLAAPFPYWFAALLIAVTGPGALSLDAVWLGRVRKGPPPQTRLWS